MKGSCLVPIMLWVERPRSEPWDIFVWYVYAFASGKQGPILCLGTVASGKNEQVIACGLAYDILSFQLLKFTMGRGGNDRYVLQIDIKFIYPPHTGICLMMWKLFSFSTSQLPAQ